MKIPERAKQLYNSDQKIEFLKSQKEHIIDNIISIFMLTQPYEASYDKDVVNFTTPEIKTMLASYTLSLDTLKFRIAYLRTYARFCIQNNYVASSVTPLSEIGSNIIDETFSIKPPAQYKTKYEFLEMMEDLELNDHKNHIAFILKYNGVEDDEMLRIKISDLQESSINVVNKNGFERNVVIDNADHDMENLRKSISLNPDFDGEYIFGRRKNGNIRSENFIRNLLGYGVNRSLPEFNRFSPKDIVNSGWMNYLITLCANHGIRSLNELGDNTNIFNKLSEKYKKKSFNFITNKGIKKLNSVDKFYIKNELQKNGVEDIANENPAYLEFNEATRIKYPDALIK